MSVRAMQVERLVAAALEGMREESVNSTGGEVLSALMTLAKRGLVAAREAGEPSARLQAGVMQLLAACGSDEKVN